MLVGASQCNTDENLPENTRGTAKHYPEQMIQLPCITGENREILVRLADTDDQHHAASVLLNRRYAWRGYGDSHRISAKPTHMTFMASIDDDVVGTITLGVDSPSGLAADDIFRDEINTLRRVPGTKLCELTKLAFDSDVPSKPMLAALFHIVFIYGYHEHACTDLLIEVNPRHRRFYQAMLGFRPIGGVKTNSSVAAPAQLMWLCVDDIRSQIDEQAGRLHNERNRSLYPFFFSQRDEGGIYDRLKRFPRQAFERTQDEFSGGVRQ